MLGCPKVISIKERKMFTRTPKMTQMIYGKRTKSLIIPKGSHYVSSRYQFTPFILRSALLSLPVETLPHLQCGKPYSLSIVVGLILQPICFMKPGHVRVTIIPFPKCICKNTVRPIHPKISWRWWVGLGVGCWSRTALSRFLYWNQPNFLFLC